MVNVSWDIKRINSVYNVYGGGDEGIQALFDEVSQLVGFIPDFSVVVEWEAVGEMAEAIGGSEAVKILLPSQRCSIRLAVGESQPLQFYLDQAVRLLGEELQKRGAG